MSSSLRLQVFLSRNGVCSRRKAFDIIQKGRVKVNGSVVDEPSTQVDPARDKISVDGKSIKEKTSEYILLYKPKGVVTTKKDRFAAKTVLDLLPKNLNHLNPVGRLDKDTEGLLLLTNDGGLTQKLTHPKFDVNKTYVVRINGELTPSRKEKLQKGVMIDGKKTWPAEIFKVKRLREKTEFCMTIHEGRNRQIRKMVEKVGSKVIYLKRIAQGPLKLGSLKAGVWRRLTQKEISELKKA